MTSVHTSARPRALTAACEYVEIGERRVSARIRREIRPTLLMVGTGPVATREKDAGEQMKTDDKAGFALVGGFAVLLIGAGALSMWMPGTQVTACGIGASGPYARVRVSSSLSDRLVQGSQERDMAVEFRYNGRLYGSGFSRVTVPRFGTVTKATAPSWHRNMTPGDPSTLTCEVSTVTQYGEYGEDGD